MYLQGLLEIEKHPNKSWDFLWNNFEKINKKEQQNQESRIMHQT